MAIFSEQTQAEYAAIRDGAALQLRPDAGVLALGDADRVDFLQRMTTNNIKALRAGQACVTVLTSPTAKIVQVFTVLARSGDLLLLPSRGETAALSRHLRGQIFFMDKVKVTDLSAQYAQLRLVGPQAGPALQALGIATSTLADERFVEQDGVLVLAQADYDVPGYAVLVPTEGLDQVQAALQGAGVVVLSSDDVYTARRVELGRPTPGAELVGEYNPLEAGLQWACAENKGCYTGQEIIARQITYEKVTRLLVTLRSSVQLPVGGTVNAEGRPAGTVTSSAWSPEQQSWLALAVVKRQAVESGAVLSTDQAGGEVTAATATVAAA